MRGLGIEDQAVGTQSGEVEVSFGRSGWTICLMVLLPPSIHTHIPTHCRTSAHSLFFNTPTCSQHPIPTGTLIHSHPYLMCLHLHTPVHAHTCPWASVHIHIHVSSIHPCFHTTTQLCIPFHTHLASQHAHLFKKKKKKEFLALLPHTTRSNAQNVRAGREFKEN